MPRVREITICKVSDCDVRIVSNGLCRKHWMRFQRHGTTDEPKDKWGHRVAHACSVDDCGLKIASHGMCKVHWGRFTRRGTTEPFVRGRKPYLDGSGYIREFVDGKRQGQLQHRLVMERIVGRPLRPGESVHHKNAIKTDNDSANLELWVHRQPTGCRVEDLLEFARGIIADYGP
jgi:hypothetical protein